MERYNKLLVNRKVMAFGECCFYIGISIELFFMIYNLGSYAVPEWLNIGRFMQIASLLFIMKMLSTRYSPKQIVVMGALLVFGLISFFATGRDEWVLRVLLMVFASKNINTETVAKYVFYVTIVGTVFIVILSLLHIGMPMINEKDYGRAAGVEARWTFGMGHPNHAHGLACYLVMLGIYLYHEKMKWHHFLILTVCNIALYLLTVSRSGLLITQFILVFMFAVQHVKWLKDGKVLYWSGIPLMAGLVAFVIFAGKHGVEGSVMSKIDTLLTNRLLYIDWYGDPKTWRLFSQADDIGRGIIDVAYGAMINAYGYAVMAAYLVMSCLLLRFFYRNRNIAGMTVLISCALYAMMENYMNSYYLMYNVVFILLLGNWNHLCQKPTENKT